MNALLLCRMLLVVSLAQAEEPLPTPAEQVPAAAAPAPGKVEVRGAVEGSLGTFPSGPLGGAQDFFGVVTPLLAVEAGEEFGFELGASLRLRIFDDPPFQRSRDFGGVLRYEDWDERSDVGQVLRLFRIGEEGSGFYLRAGPVRLFTLGRGQLVTRYGNQLNPDYHPAGAELAFAVRAVRGQFFASDLLSGRLFAGELSGDLARIFGSEPKNHDRYHLSLSAAHDSGRAGYLAPRLSLMHLDLDAALHKGEKLRLWSYFGTGTRLLALSPDLGASLGLSVDGDVASALQLSGKAELRKQNGLFRQGMFGPTYELSRFAAQGLSGPGIADEVLPDSFSGYFEAGLSFGARGDTLLGGTATAAAELFAFGRTDFDAAVDLLLIDGRLTASGHFIVVALGQTPRYHLQAEARFRLWPSFYLLAGGGILFFPQPDRPRDFALARGIVVLAGAGVDFER